MVPFTASAAIETAQLPILVSIAGVGCLVVIYRRMVLGWCESAFGTSAGGFIGRAFVAVGGYGWLLIGLMGVLLWAFDQIAY